MWVGIQLICEPVGAIEDKDIARQLESMNWYSEEFPPYNFVGEDELITGISVDILMAALNKVGANVPLENIKVIPWKEGYKHVLQDPGTALFSTTYTPEREQVMKFVGPIVPIRVSVITPRHKKTVIKDASDLGALKIGVVRDDVGDQLIRKFALSDDNIAKKDTLKQLTYFFQRGRVDAIAYASNVFSYSLKSSGANPNQFEEVFLLKEGHLGYAFHKSTSSEVLNKLQLAIDGLRANGTINEIIAQYTK